MVSKPRLSLVNPSGTPKETEAEREAEGLELLLHWTRRKFENAVIRLAEQLRERGLE